MERRATTGIAILLATIVGMLPGCLSPEQAVEEVDREAKAAITDRATEAGLPTDSADPSPKPDRVRTRILDPGSYLVREGSSFSIDLESVLKIAAANSREFQDQKERVYRAALAYLREREEFALRPGAIFSASATRSGGETSIASDAGFGLTRAIERGGAVALSLGLDFLRFVTSPTSETLSSFLDLSIALPFLRNAGLEIAQENLTQADRDLLYALRDFERFKQEFGVQVLSLYLRILSQSQRVANEEANVERLAQTRARNEAMFAEGRMRVVEVDQAKQQELEGRSRLIATKESLDRSLDGLKDTIGLPVDLLLQVSGEDLKKLASPADSPLAVEELKALRVAMKARLDLRNAVDGVADAERRVRVAENQLLPDFTLDLGARPISNAMKPLRYNFQDGTYSAGVTFDPGLYREIESIALRLSLLERERSLRDQEATVESVKSQVREALRQLHLAADQYRISREAFTLAEKRVASSDALLAEGRVTTRDFLESQNAFISSQNTLLDAIVDYRIATLGVLRDTGVLVVTEEGCDDAASRRELLVD